MLNHHRYAAPLRRMWIALRSNGRAALARGAAFRATPIASRGVVRARSAPQTSTDASSQTVSLIIEHLARAGVR